jgi:hypothetical protein
MFKNPRVLTDAMGAMPEQIEQAVKQRDHHRAQAAVQAGRRARATSARWHAALADEVADVASRASDPEPIAGVTLATYAQIALQVVDPAAAAGVAQLHGVAAEAWAAALQGWNDRLTGDGPLAARFVQLCGAAR